ncbi:Uncharacterized protein APZ42_023391 [Daphnia magna]|uniref:Uncharacterized protein n=1 Tax=Daphnia magna TaxID=35525 RepID=A0A164UZQ0_9CRUS|nr:Uncharacterized protein APZ42_023391 [Daphnia magna]
MNSSPFPPSQGWCCGTWASVGKWAQKCGSLLFVCASLRVSFPCVCVWDRPDLNFPMSAQLPPNASFFFFFVSFLYFFSFHIPSFLFLFLFFVTHRYMTVCVCPDEWKIRYNICDGISKHP